MNAKKDICEYYKTYIETEKATFYTNELFEKKKNDEIQDNNVIAKNIVIEEIKKTKCKETQLEPDHE